MYERIPDSFIRELIDKTSIIDIIEEHVPLKKRGGSYIACCPFHNEKTPSFNVSENKQLYYCFGCNAGGNVISFLMAYHNENFIKTCERLAHKLGLELPVNKKQQQTNQKNALLKKLLAKVSEHYQRELGNNPEAKQYLAKRALSSSTIAKFQLGYALDAWHNLETTFTGQKEALIETGMLIKKDNGQCYDRYRDRVMFPIHNEYGEIIGFGGRAIKPEQNPKYLNSPETPLFHKSHELYGLYQAKQDELKHFILVEGYMDVIALTQAGITGAVATLGTASNEQHIKKLCRLNSHLIFCFDGDEAGQKASLRAMEQALVSLQDEHNFQFLCLPDKHDPDSFVQQNGKEAFLDKVKASPNIIDYLLSHLRPQVDLSQTAGKARLITLTKKYFKELKAKAYQSILINKLSLMLRMESEQLRQILSESGSHPPPFLEIPRQNQRSKLLSIWQRAIAMLVQYPKEYKRLKPYLDASKLPIDKTEFLNTLIPYLEEGLESATLLEALRDTPYFAELYKLAMVELLTPESGIHHELVDIFQRLERDHLQEQIKMLLQKVQSQNISDKERLKLQKLIQESQRPQSKDNV